MSIVFGINPADTLTQQLGTITGFGDFPDIHLAQQAYVNNYGTDGGVRYYAHGVDADGNDYIVAWETTAAWDEEQERYRTDADFEPSLDESDACDWNEPVSVQAL